MQEVYLFRNIPKEYINDLLKNMNARTIFFKKDMTILSNLNNINEVGIVKSGRVSLIRIDYNGERSIVSEFKKNELFGGCFSNYQNEELSVVADIDSEIIFVEYNKLLKKEHMNIVWHETLVENVVDMLVNKINTYNMRIEILTKKTTRDKLLEYFHTLEREQLSKKILLPYNYTKLAEYLSVDRSALMREIKNLKEDGFIDTNGKTIILMDSM